MTIIDGIDVAIYKCDNCQATELWLFKGQNNEGYKIVCAKCKAEQRQLIEELKLPYLWKHLEDKSRLSHEDRLKA